MEISEKGLLHYYQQASTLIGYQTNHRTNMFFPYQSMIAFVLWSMTK